MIALKLKNSKEELIIKVGLSKITLGRSSKCDYKINDELCSSLHCMLKLEKNGRLSIKDLGSTNGTFINGNTITETFVYLGDKIKVGESELELDPSKMDKNEIMNHQNDLSAPHQKEIRMSVAKKKSEDEEGNKKPSIGVEQSKKQQARQKELKAFEARKADLKKKEEEEALEESLVQNPVTGIITKIIKIFKK